MLKSERNDKPRPFKPDLEAVKKYEAQIASLQVDLTKAAHDLSELETKKSVAKSEISEIERRKFTLEEQMKDLGEKLSRAKSDHEQYLSLVHSERAKIAEKTGDLKTTVFSSLANEETFIRKRVKDLAEEERRLLLVVPKLSAQEKKAKTAEQRAIAAEKKAAAAEKKVKEDLAKIESAQRKFNEEKDAVNDISGKTERTRATIEVYVRRLQRRYDKAGIKIDLLKQFNIKRK